MQEDDEIAWADEPDHTAAEPVASQSDVTLPSSVGRTDAVIYVLIVDDDEEVHRVTLFTLSNLEIDGAKVEFVHARSSEEAKEILRQGQRFAVILLDVVMEDDESGFRLVRFIRNELGEKASRIIMRTGQPGSVPERDLILQYDINDYRNKTELTAMTLFTAVVTAARTFNDILRIEENSKSLSWVMEDAKKLFSVQSGASEMSILELAYLQFGRHLGNEECVTLVKLTDGLCTEVRRGKAEGTYEGLNSRSMGVDLRDGLISIKVEHHDSQYILLGTSSKELSEDALGLLELLRKNIQIALDNLKLRERLENLQVNLRRFVPQEALSFFDVDDVRGLEMGKSFELEACIVFMRFELQEESGNAKVEESISRVVQVILQNDGLVDKFTTDGLLAIFFQPSSAGRDALRAVDGIRTMLHEIDGAPGAFDIKCGVNYGTVTFGLVGYEERLELTVMGDSVNIASRIKSICQLLPCSTLVSGEVIRRYGLEDADIRRLGHFHLRGRQESIDCVEFLGGIDSERRAQMNAYRLEFESVIDEQDDERIKGLWKELSLRYPDDALIDYFHAHANERAPHEHSRFTDLIS